MEPLAIVNDREQLGIGARVHVLAVGVVARLGIQRGAARTIA